jgi:uncharacterized protein
MEKDVNGLEVFSRAEAIALLETQDVGRLVYTRRALPAVRPVNFVVCGGGILIRTGWSVAVTGTAQLVTDEAQLARAERCVAP